MPQQAKDRWGRVPDPEPEPEAARRRAAGRVEDDVVPAGFGTDRSRGAYLLQEDGEVRIQVDRERRVAGQLVLVSGDDHARLDADTPRLAEDRDAEVRHRRPQPHPKDLLGALEHD